MESQLKKVRKIIGLTQEELSKKSGVDVGTIRSYEQGWASINNASVSRVIKLAKALGVNIEDILDID